MQWDEYGTQELRNEKIKEWNSTIAALPPEIAFVFFLSS
jgi:hypothetical protein